MPLWKTDRYRLYALDRVAGVVGEQAFSAPSEAQAREAGYALLKACNDACTSVEIWKGYRRIARFETDDGGRMDFFPTEGPAAQLAMELAAALAGSGAAVARSRRLAAILARRGS